MEAVWLTAPKRRNALIWGIKAHLRCRRLPHLTLSSPHAGAGGARSRAISARMTANICRDTATSAIWNVT